MVKTTIAATKKYLSTLCPILIIIIILFSSCDRNSDIDVNSSSTIETASSTTSSGDSSEHYWGDYPLAMIRIDGKYYSCIEMAVDAPDEALIIGYITSVRPEDSDVWWCIQDDQASAGFPEFLNAPYAKVNGEIIIRHGEEWHRLCESDWVEPSSSVDIEQP